MKIEIKVGSTSRTYTTRSGAAYITVGSRPGSDIVIDDPGVSPIHLKFEHFVDRWSYTDQMSDTGTKHNGETKYSAELAEGDRVEIGGAVLKVLDLLLELDVAPKAARSTDRSWQDEIKPTADKPTSGYKRNVDSNYTSKEEGGYSSGKDAEYAASNEDGEAYHRGTDHAEPPKPAPVRQQGSSGAKPAPKAIAVVVMLVMMALLAGGVFFALGTEGEVDQDTLDRDRAELAREAQKQADAQRNAGDTGGEPVAPKIDGRMPREVENEIKTKLDAITSPADERAPAEKLEDYYALKKQADEYKEKGLSWPFERAMTVLSNQLFTEMQERYGKDNGDSYDLEQAHKYRELTERLTALDAYFKQSDLHAELARQREMQKWVDRELPHIAEANGWYIGECFARADEALQRNDYGAAVLELNGPHENAVLTDTLAQGIDTELIALAELGVKQQNGEGEPKRAPFDRRKDKLPAAPVSTLLPKGEGSSYGEMNDLKKRLDKTWKAGGIDGVDCTFYGRKAQLQPKTDDWRMVLKVTHPYANGGSFDYSVRYGQQNLPPETMISLYETISPTRNELLAMLLICFNEGLVEDARRIACKLWHADETVKADLDQLLATKLKIEVPEGGFVEKDGKLVAPD